MKKALFISFDFIRKNECNKSLAMASIISYLKQDRRVTDNFELNQYSCNMLNESNLNTVENVLNEINIEDFFEYKIIAISAYIWNEYLTNDLIREIKKRNFKGKIVLGGYQISYSDPLQLQSVYPNADYFIFNYGEESVKKILLNEVGINEKFLKYSVDFSNIPSPYLSGELSIDEEIKMVRFETKRGCPYKCNFCAHRDLGTSKVHILNLEKSYGEIEYFRNKDVKKVNVLDPIFNSGGDYLLLMNEINRINTNTTYSLQARFEAIAGESGNKFLDLCANGKYHLEFGVQTIVEQESLNVNRRNNFTKIDNTLDVLNKRNISFEVSIIYGLPGQTLDSFRRSVDYLKSKNCDIIKAYPLMLLRGTEIYDEKEKWNFKEEIIGDYNIPLVTSSSTFKKDDWVKMKEVSESLFVSNRIL